jgi:hypothetical protein
MTVPDANNRGTRAPERTVSNGVEWMSNDCGERSTPKGDLFNKNKAGGGRRTRTFEVIRRLIYSYRAY